MTRAGIDVLIATYNGARTWPVMLEALSRLATPRRPVRYLVVDNGSSDATPAILREWAGRLPIVPLACPEPGKMAALKFGARHIEGDLVLMTDDDVVPAQSWLMAYEEAADAHPEAALFGGPITPRPLEPLDPWYEVCDGFRDVLFALSDEPEGPVDAVRSVYGPNYLMRANAARYALEKAPAIGPTRGSTFPLGDETTMIRDVGERFGGFWYVRGAGVEHLVRRDYTTLDYMLKRAQRHGRGVAILEARHAWNLPARASRLLESAVRAAKLRLETAKLDTSRPDAEVFRRLYFYNWNIGAAKGAWGGPF